MSEKSSELLLSCRVVDEKTGGVFNLSTDGEIFVLTPKYDTGFDSLMRFYRFLVEKIDSDAKIQIDDEEVSEDE